MLYAIAVMAVSLLVLAKSSHLVISNATRLARTLGIGELAAGFVLVSVSTSLPELSVSVLAASRGEGAMIAALYGLGAGLIGQEVYSAILLMSLLTTIATPMLLKRLYA